MPHKTRIQSLSSLMVVFCSIAMISIPIWIGWYWATLAERLPALQAQYPDSLFSIEYISNARWALAAALSLSTSLVLVFALWQLRGLFTLFQQGVVFSNGTTHRLYRFAAALFISAVLQPITTGLLSVLLSWGNPPGQRTLIFTLGSNEAALMLFAATFLIITWVFREGLRLTQENEAFV